MTKPTLSALIFFSLILPGQWGCQGPPPAEPSRSALPEVRELEKEAPPSKPQLIDSIGRLVEGEVSVDGFPFPLMAAEITEEGATSRSFRIPALQRALLEFYMHRDFHVLKLPTGHRIKHSSITRERTGDDNMGLGALFVTQRGQRNQFVRFIPHTPPLVHLPRVNKEVLEEEGSQWTDEQQKAMGSAVKSIEKMPKKKPKRRVVVPFNPSLPRTMGTKSTKKQVKKWLKDNPGKVFYD